MVPRTCVEARHPVRGVCCLPRRRSRLSGFRRRSWPRLPGDYAPPRGRLLLAPGIDSPAGCVALRPLEPGCLRDEAAVRSARVPGPGLGPSLAERDRREAPARGLSVHAAGHACHHDERPRALPALGFRAIPPYRNNPVPGPRFSTWTLGARSRPVGLTSRIHDTRSLAFLKSLLDTPGPSSFEAAPARVWRAEAERFADAVRGRCGGQLVRHAERRGGPG